MNDKSWEQQAVDEIIAAEDRIEAIERELERLDETHQIARALGLNTHSIDDKMEALESELYDLKKEVDCE